MNSVRKVNEMKNYVVIFTVVVFLLLSTMALAETVKTETFTYLIRYDDGMVEKKIIKYIGTATERRWQTGKHSSWRHPTDTRQCHWEFQSNIKRDICLVARSGEQYCEGKHTKIFSLPQIGEGKHFNWSKFQGDNCGKMANTISSQFNQVKSILVNEWAGIINRDKQSVENLLRSHPSVHTIQRVQ